MTRMRLIYIDKIRFNPFNLCHPCSIENFIKQGYS